MHLFQKNPLHQPTTRGNKTFDFRKHGRFYAINKLSDAQQHVCNFSSDRVQPQVHACQTRNIGTDSACSGPTLSFASYYYFFFPQQLLVYDEANDATGEPILQWADDMQQAVEDSCFVLTFKTSFVFYISYYIILYSILLYYIIFYFIYILFYFIIFYYIKFHYTILN